MKNNKSGLVSNTPNLAASLTLKPLLSPANKKVEGFDKTTSSQLFNSKVNKLKNKPKVEGLEDQYISGLQDEIKYLQMQLKLLQEKDQQRHGQIDQLQKFFGDGIPINENILAIKNGFNSYKHSNQKKAKELTSQKQERSTLINSLAQKVQTLLVELNEHEKNYIKGKESNQNNWYQLIYQEAALKRSLEKQEDELKVLKQQSRRMFENIEKATRNKLIENMMIIKLENNKMNKFNQLKENIMEKEAELLDLQKQQGMLSKAEEEKSYVLKLEEENLGQRKKNIALEREHDNLKNKIKEKNMELQEKLKDRMTEINSRIDINNKVNQLKEQISQQNSITIELVSDLARNKEIQALGRIVDNNKKLAKYTDHYSALLANIENSIESLAQRKPEVKAELQTYQAQLVKLTAKQQSQKEREINLHAEMVQIQQKFNQSKMMITPLQQKIRKNTAQIQAYQQQKRRLLQEIKIKQKQLELIFILKGLNFDEAEISKSTNSSIQQELTSFLKNWEKIQRNA